MKHVRLVVVTAAAAVVAFHSPLVSAQATLNLNDGVLRIPSVTVGADVYTNVILRYGADGRFALEGATPPAGNPPPAGGVAQTIQLSYAPQPNTQYWYDGANRRVATCSGLAQASITLKVPANATAQARVPLVISLAGWAPSGNPPAPVPQDPAGLEQFSAAGMAAATFEYRGCDNWSSPLIARTHADESYDIASSDFGLGLAAIKAAVAARNLPIDTSRIVVAGTSFSSNLIFTVATQHRLQGAIALAGGCDYNCNATGTIYEQPNDFRINGAAIRVAAISGSGDTLFSPMGLGSSGYGASGARARILGAIPDAAKRPAAFYTYVAPGAGHEVNAAMWGKARTFAQCMTNVRPAGECAADDR